MRSRILSEFSVHARHAVERGPVFLSVLCYWEVMVKSMKGKLGSVTHGRGGRMLSANWVRAFCL